MLVALELDDGVDNVFQYLRSGQGAFLGDVAYQYDGHAAGLGEAQQGGGTLAHLGYGAGAGLYVLGGYGLYGVDDEQVGLHVLGMLEDFFEGVGTKNEEVVGDGIVGRCGSSGVGRNMGGGEALGAHLELVGALLAADVEHALVGQCQHGLQRQRGLAYAGFAAQQNDAAGHQPAAQDTVQLLVVHVDARVVV